MCVVCRIQIMIIINVINKSMYDTLEAMAHSIIALNPSLSGKGRLWQAILGVRASSTFAQWIVALQSHVTRRIHETSTAQKTPKTQKEVSLILPMLGLLCRKFSSILRIAWFPVSSSKILAFVFFFTRGRGAESLLNFGAARLALLWESDLRNWCGLHLWS